MKSFALAVLFFPLAGAAVAEPLDCVIEPARVIDLGSREEGNLDALLVERGDLVEQGQIIARLDSQLQERAVAAMELRASDDVTTRSNEERLRFQDIQIERFGQLAERQIASRQRLQEIEVERELSRIAVEASRLDFEIVQVEAENARILLNRRIIRSPVDGVVVRIETDAGEMVLDQTVIMIIADITTLHVEAFVPIAFYRRIAVGDTAKVHLPEPLDITRTATVSVIDRVFDAASGTFGVRLIVDNSDLSVPAGLRCKLFFDFVVESEND